MGFMQIVLLAFLSTPALVNAGSECPTDNRLGADGWVVHPTSQLNYQVKRLLEEKGQNQADYTLDMSSRMMSWASNRPVQVDSFDRPSTPQTEMYGDLLVVTDLNSSKVSEIRWYEGKKKHVAYNSEFQKCAMAFIPMAENALF